MAAAIGQPSPPAWGGGMKPAHDPWHDHERTHAVHTDSAHGSTAASARGRARLLRYLRVRQAVPRVRLACAKVFCQCCGVSQPLFVYYYDLHEFFCQKVYCRILYLGLRYRTGTLYFVRYRTGTNVSLT